MKVVVLGAGAMGSLFGAMLVKAGNVETYMIDIWEEHVKTMNENGLTIQLSDKDEIIKPIYAFTSPEDVAKAMDGYADLIIVFVKGMFTETAIEEARCIIGPDTVFMTTQNGVGNGGRLAMLVDPQKVYFGTTSEGSNILAPGKIRFTSEKKDTCTHLMPFEGDITEKLIEICDLFTKAGLKTVASKEAEALVWEKLTLNAIGNCMSVLLRLTPFVFINDASGSGERLCEMMIDEIVAVAEAKGLDFDKERISWVMPFMRKLDGYASMGFDAKNHKPTEIDSINGAIAREGKKYGVPTPINETLYHMVNLVQNNYDKLWY